MTGLFRKQVMDNQSNRLHGEIILLPRISHLIILSFILTWVFLAFVWLSTSSFARKETVIGWLDPSSGIVRVYADEPGIIKQLLVQEGEFVEKDQPLAIINGDRVLVSGTGLESLLLDEFEQQKKLLNDKLERDARIYIQKTNDILRRIGSNKEDLAILEKQINTQNERFLIISDQVVRYRKLNEKGHISTLELEAVIAQELELSADSQLLARNKINLVNKIEQLELEKRLLPDEYANENSLLRERLSDLAQRVAELHGRKAYVVKASKSGYVGNLQVREGQLAKTTAPLLSVVPKGYKLKAQLLVPVRSAGFLKAGQKINIRYDAFPYQKFGLYQGHLNSVSNSILLPDELVDTPVRISEPVFKVSADLDSMSVVAYGRDFSLKPGMTFSADIELSERTLLQWLLEPIYSLKGRL